MIALTVCQPWAWALVHGPKRIENRTWATTYRGPLLIHAGKSRAYLCDVLNDGTPVPHDRLVFGAALGVVELFDCVRVRDAPGNPFAEGPWCWLVRDPRPLPRPVPLVGKQGLFVVTKGASLTP